MNLESLDLHQVRNWVLSHKAQHQVLAGLCVFVVIGLLAYVLVWREQLSQAQALEEQIGQLVNQLDQDTLLLLKSQKLRAELALLEQQLPALKTALPTQAQVAVLLARINGLLENSGLQLVEFSPQPVVDEEVMRVIPVKLVVRGDGSAIAKVPNQVVSLSRQVGFESFDMTLEEDNASNAWQLHATLKAYSQLPPRSSSHAQANLKGGAS